LVGTLDTKGVEYAFCATAFLITASESFSSMRVYWMSRSSSLTCLGRR
jgi:hypothetical protein